MKEYNLIRKEDDSHAPSSEVDTLHENIHQDCGNSLLESSEVIVNTAKSTKQKIPRTSTSRRKVHRHTGGEESDSDFELPSYSTKSAVKTERSVRRRNKTVKAYPSDESLNELNERLNIDNSEEDLQKSDQHSIGDDAIAAHPRVEVDKKPNNDSTHEGSICGRKRKERKVLENSRIQVNQNIEPAHTDFGQVSSRSTKCPKPSNFGYLVEAANIQSGLLKREATTHKCESAQNPSAFNRVIPAVNLVTQLQGLGHHTGLFNNQNFNSLYPGLVASYPVFNPMGYFNLN